MSEKEYIVSLNKDVDYDQFNQDMIASNYGSGCDIFVSNCLTAVNS